MVYKIGNASDLESIPIEEGAKGLLYRYASILSDEYGENRNVDTDLGGYVLFAVPGTPAEEIKASFDYTKNAVEYAETSGSACALVYILSSDYGVVIVMSTADAPEEMQKEIENKRR